MEPDTPVALITVDTLRADRFREDCLPESLPLLKEDFAHFTNAYSQGNGTPFAFPAIVSGHPVVGNGRFPDSATPIGDLFSGRATGFSNNGHLSPDRGYGRGFESFHDQYAPDDPDDVSTFERIKQHHRLQNSDAVVYVYQNIRQILEKIKQDWGRTISTSGYSAGQVTDFIHRRINAGDAFIWGHYMDPHTPWGTDIAIDPPETNRSTEELLRLVDYKYETDPHPEEDLEFLKALYESNIRYFDREFARLLRELREQSWYDDALIIFTADHGELFGEHGCMFHPGHIDPVEELLEVPLLAKFPDSEHAGREFDHLVQHGDIIATVAEWTGTAQDQLPRPVHPLTDTTDRRVISKSNVAVRLTEPGGYAVRRRDGTSEGTEDISSSGRDLMNDASFPVVESMAGDVVGVEDAERRKRLKNLGYQ